MNQNVSNVGANRPTLQRKGVFIPPKSSDPLTEVFAESKRKVEKERRDSAKASRVETQSGKTDLPDLTSLRVETQSCSSAATARKTDDPNFFIPAARGVVPNFTRRGKMVRQRVDYNSNDSADGTVREEKKKSRIIESEESNVTSFHRGKGRVSNVSAVLVSSQDLAAYKFIRRLKTDLTSDQMQKIPPTYLDESVPVCKYCHTVVIGKKCAYVSHHGACPCRKEREEDDRAEYEATLTRTSMPEVDFDVRLSEAFIRSGVSVTQLNAIVKSLVPEESQSKSTMYRKIWSTLEQQARTMMAQLRQLLAQGPLVVAIDAGTCLITHQHMLVAVVYYKGRGFLLPPACQSVAFTASNVKDALEHILSQIGRTVDDVDMWMADGCRVNHAFFDMLDFDDKYLESVVEGYPAMDEGSQLLQFTRAIRHNVYCRGHWINVILSHCQNSLEETYPLACEALTLFKQSLYNANGRGARLKEYIMSFNLAKQVCLDDKRAKLKELLEVIDLSSNLTGIIDKVSEHIDLPEDEQHY